MVVKRTKLDGFCKLNMRNDEVEVAIVNLFLNLFPIVVILKKVDKFVDLVVRLP